MSNCMVSLGNVCISVLWLAVGIVVLVDGGDDVSHHVHVTRHRIWIGRISVALMRLDDQVDVAECAC